MQRYEKRKTPPCRVVFNSTRRSFPAKPLQVGCFSAYLSSFSRKTSTGRLFFGLPVEETGQNLYGSAIFCLTRRGNRAKPLQVGHFLPYPSRKPGKSSTGRLFFGLPVEFFPQNLYRSAIFCLTRRGNRAKALQVGHTFGITVECRYLYAGKSGFNRARLPDFWIYKGL